MNKPVTTIMLEELLSEPTEFLSEITGWQIAQIFSQEVGLFTRRRFRLTSPDGSRVINVRTKTWRRGEDLIEDRYKVAGVGDNLPATYVLDLT